jgi:hypothetical protein
MKHRAETKSFTRREIPLSDSEIVAAVLALTVGDAEYHRTFEVRGRKVRLQNRGPAAQMGRFGGGWQNSVGMQLGRRGLRGTVIVNLWKGSIRIDPKPADS